MTSSRSPNMAAVPLGAAMLRGAVVAFILWTVVGEAATPSETPATSDTTLAPKSARGGRGSHHEHVMALSPISVDGKPVRYTDVPKLADTEPCFQGSTFRTAELRAGFTQFDHNPETQNDVDRCGATVVVATCLWKRDPGSCLHDMAQQFCHEVTAEFEREQEWCRTLPGRFSGHSATVGDMGKLVEVIFKLTRDSESNALRSEDMYDLFHCSLHYNFPTIVGVESARSQGICGSTQSGSGSSCSAAALAYSFRAEQCWPARIMLGSTAHWLLLCGDPLSTRRDVWVFDPMPLPSGMDQSYHVQYSAAHGRRGATHFDTPHQDRFDKYQEAMMRPNAGIIPVPTDTTGRAC